MKSTTLLCCGFFALLIGLSACKKSQTSKVTGMPIEGASIYGKTKHKGLVCYSPDNIAIYTNAAGEFSLGPTFYPVEPHF